MYVRVCNQYVFSLYSYEILFEFVFLFRCEIISASIKFDTLFALSLLLN